MGREEGGGFRMGTQAQTYKLEPNSDFPMEARSLSGEDGP